MPHTERDGAVDALKAVSILGVIFIHQFATAALPPVRSAGWYLALFWGVVLRAAVPVFFLCTGALMLDPAKEIHHLYRKYILRIVVALFFWASMYELFDYVRDPAAGVWAHMKKLVTFDHHFHLYFLQIIVFVYILLPLLRLFVRHAEERLWRYVLVIWFLITIMAPFLVTFHPFSLFETIVNRYMLNLTYAAVGYALLGYYLKAHPGRIRYFAALYALGFGTVYIGTVCLSGERLTVNFLAGASPGVACMTAGLAGMAFAYFAKRRAWPMACSVAQGSFCVYLIHDFFNIWFRDWGLLRLGWPPFVSIPVLSLLNLLCSLLVYAVLRHIPVVRRYLI